MKQPNTNSARLEFSSPEINVGIAAAKRKKSPAVPKQKNVIVAKKATPFGKSVKVAVVKPKTAKSILKRKK